MFTFGCFHGRIVETQNVHCFSSSNLLYSCLLSSGDAARDGARDPADEPRQRRPAAQVTWGMLREGRVLDAPG